jgi:hypothetical protein
LLVAVLAVGLVVVSEPAGAVGGVKKLGGDITFIDYQDNGDHWGPEIGAHFAYGLDDATDLDFRASAAYLNIHSAGSGCFTQVVALNYFVDVVQWVPYIGGGLSLSETVGHDAFSWRYGIYSDIGVNYVSSRELTFGVQAFAHFQPLNVQDASSTPAHFLIGLSIKADYTWGWF